MNTINNYLENIEVIRKFTSSPEFQIVLRKIAEQTFQGLEFSQSLSQALIIRNQHWFTDPMGDILDNHKFPLSE